MRRLLARFVVDECGATAIEYALIAGGISIVIVTAVNGVGTALSAGVVDVGLRSNSRGGGDCNGR